MKYSELPLEYQKLVRERVRDRVAEINTEQNNSNHFRADVKERLEEDDIRRMFSWSQTPESTRFWHLVHTAVRPSELPPITQHHTSTPAKRLSREIKLRKYEQNNQD